MLSIHSVPAGQLTPDDLHRWEEILSQHHQFDSPYFHPTYTMLAAGVRNNVEVGILAQHGEAVGYFPYQRNRFGVAKPVGDRLSDFHGVIVDPRVDWSMDHLLKNCKLRVFAFDHLLVGHTAFEPAISTIAGSPYLNMSSGFDDYLDNQCCYARSLKQCIRKRNKLEREHGPLTITLESDSEQDFQQLMQWKIDQYRRTNAFNPLQFAWVQELLRNIWATRTEAFAGVFSTIRIGDTLIGAHFGMRSYGTLHSWFPAYNPEFYKYSPGNIMLLEIAKASALAGVAKIDLGKGTEDYKLSFGSAQTRVAEGVASRSAFAARLGKRMQAAKAWVKQSRFSTPVLWTANLVRPLREWWAFR